ncbi:MAG: SDR family oxidoreductase [Lachnospiraceae bacterium]|nr:SDR family oxidoreductase [Lachnospiraceae bacterium]
MGYHKVVFSEDSMFLVTGGAGFIGSNLCEVLLKKGYRVRCLDNLSTGREENIRELSEYENFTFVKGDICNLDTCKKLCEDVDYVLHQAAWGSVPRSIEMPLYYEEVNIRGTLNMMQAAREAGVKRFVYASSSSVYGDSTELPKVEGREGNLLSPYAFTKRADEEYGKLYSALYGLETVGLRYFNVFGRRQDPSSAYAAVIPKFIRLLLKGKTPEIHGDGLQSRDFTYIENVIEANLKACASKEKIAGEVFNVAFGGQETILSMYQDICNELGIFVEPKFVEARKGDIKHSNANIDKAKRLLSYNPEYGFKEGLHLTIDWYKEHLI